MLIAAWWVFNLEGRQTFGLVFSLILVTLGTGLLGQVPLLPEIRAGGDAGKPAVVSEPGGAAAEAFRAIAQSLLDRLATAGR